MNIARAIQVQTIQGMKISILEDLGDIETVAPCFAETDLIISLTELTSRSVVGGAVMAMIRASVAASMVESKRTLVPCSQQVTLLSPAALKENPRTIHIRILFQ